MQRTFTITEYDKDYGYGKYQVKASNGLPYERDTLWGIDTQETLFITLNQWLSQNNEKEVAHAPISGDESQANGDV